jgi:hypothetical protein
MEILREKEFARILESIIIWRRNHYQMLVFEKLIQKRRRFFIDY